MFQLYYCLCFRVDNDKEIKEKAKMIDTIGKENRLFNEWAILQSIKYVFHSFTACQINHFNLIINFQWYQLLNCK